MADIVTAWLNDQGLIGRVIDFGADDLLLRPFSATLLESRIRVHAERRKDFVTTSDYVGPDRRRDQARTSNVVHLLGHAALHLKQFFEPRKSETEHLGEINATVTMIYEREAQALAS